MCAQPVPDWLLPPPEGFAAQDLDRLPNLPPHTELIDGSLVFVSPQKIFHSLMLDLLVHTLRLATPEGLRARREMSVILDRKQRPEPDVLVVHEKGEQGTEQTAYDPGVVELAIEVVSPDSEKRDRERKPQLYAQAGIPHFWRVEEHSGQPVVYVYELDPATQKYSPTGIYHDRVQLTVPFTIDIDLSQIERM